MPSGIYTRTDPITRFWRRTNKAGPVHPTLGPCWQWRGAPHRSGYGRHKGAEGVVYAHRFAYALLVGPIPDGLQIDHLCRNTMCVRPEHLEAVTQKTNMNRGVGPAGHNHRKTRCPRDHPLSGDNLYSFVVKKTGTMGRRCRICAAAVNQRHRERVARR